jgi:hypothetical protein
MDEYEFNLFLSELFHDFGSVLGHNDTRSDAVKEYDKAIYAEHNAVSAEVTDAEYDFDDASYLIEDEWYDCFPAYTDAEEDESGLVVSAWDAEDELYANDAMWNIKRKYEN